MTEGSFKTFLIWYLAYLVVAFFILLLSSKIAHKHGPQLRTAAYTIGAVFLLIALGSLIGSMVGLVPNYSNPVESFAWGDILVTGVMGMFMIKTGHAH